MVNVSVAAAYLVVHTAVAVHVHCMPFVPRLDNARCRFWHFEVDARDTGSHPSDRLPSALSSKSPSLAWLLPPPTHCA